MCVNTRTYICMIYFLMYENYCGSSDSSESIYWRDETKRIQVLPARRTTGLWSRSLDRKDEDFGCPSGLADSLMWKGAFSAYFSSSRPDKTRTDFTGSIFVCRRDGEFIAGICQTIDLIACSVTRYRWHVRCTLILLRFS